MENKEMQKKEMVPGITSTAPEGNHLAPIKKASWTCFFMYTVFYSIPYFAQC